MCVVPSGWTCSVCGKSADVEDVVVWRRDEIIGEVDFHVVHVDCETSETEEYPLAENIPEFTEHYPGVLYPGHSDSRIPKDSDK